MSTKEEPPPSLPKLMTLNKGLKLAQQWVKNMPGDLEEVEDVEVEGRPSRLGLGAKVPRKSHVGPFNDPVERRLHKKFGAGRKKSAADDDSILSAKNEIDIDDEDDDENLDSRTNAFAKKRAAPLNLTPQAKKKFK
ncbi:uncharacterized protein LOC104907543 [Beta vulgaris subsp. vulgaris]|uniref:uncharacterized protein LOC104907543 n=1 Tax=Beta vulgaris subsp. vulgaris TaxID=3555 RepID=UPI00203736D5|nr:uncharacterized protein LOC104907543 [Beta vulgaris subsp. vulgaris]XP_010694783.2 uncharacterized protein LOC104907543 [Beta vulgaris subsp. vulgaris]XP_010694784.2 uncharacterized protein LOC104907543 [Beta vulgaris subsp. vulgaris]XP_010694785.2 uncharacterized protein LOC104907543 [Beta vulgaris subsp. vulgaris]XP_019108165.2 uncharacterized protein LOC104907543 [Beta vulgaris subsp. vulgaris]XP_048499144.1 uncharacterized protein LOC104907543 [Beta vulgaris subsp. vulgaris]XP_04849914